MKLEGIVRATEMPDIFHLLSSSGREGVLVVSKGGARRRIYFGGDGVTLFFDSRRSWHLLGQILIGRGIITEQILADALEKQQATAIPLGEILCNSGAAKPEQIESALTYQLREELFDVLTWENARFEFLENADKPVDPGRTYDRTPSFNTDAIIMEAARRADEWHRIRDLIPGENVVLLKTEESPVLLDELAENEVAGLVLKLADGACSMHRMVETLRRSQFDVFESSYALLNAGVVKAASARELADIAADALEKRDTERARAVLLNAAALCGDDLELRYDLGTMLMGVGEEESAEENLDIVLRKLVEGDLKGKIDQMLNHLRDDFPDRPYSYERRMKLLDPKRDFESAMTLATRLLEIYDARSDGRTANRMMRFLAKFQASDVDQLLRLATMLEAHGEAITAARRYYEAANQLRYAGMNEAAVTYYRKAVELDGLLTAAQKELDYLLTGKRRRRRRLIVASAAGVFLLALVVGAWIVVVYEKRARARLDDLDVQTDVLIAEQKFDQAIAAYAGFLDEYHYTSVRGRARKRIEQLGELKDAQRMVAHNAARQLVHNAEEAERALDLDRAIGNYRRLEQSDFSADLVEKARSNIRRLTSEREEYAALVSKARALEQSGEYEEALTTYFAARERSGRLFERDAVKLPLRVESVPPGAQVVRGEDILGATPLLLHRGEEEEVSVVLKQEGFYDTPLDVRARPARAVASASLIPTRKPGWTFRADGAVDDPPTRDGDVYYLSTRQGRICAVARADGTRLWERKLDAMPGAYVSAPVVMNDRLIVVTMDGSLHAFSRDGKKELWNWKARAMVVGPPVPSADGRLMLACADGRILFIDPADGRCRRAVKLPHRLFAWPVVLGSTVCYVTEAGSATAFDLETERPAWELGVGASSARPMTCFDGTLYALLDDGELLAISAADGQPLWRYRTPESGVTVPASDGTRVYLGTLDGRLIALEAKTGRAAWTVAADGGMTMPPSTDGEHVFVATDAKVAMVFNREGKLLWKRDLSGKPASSPMIVDDRVFFTGSDGELQAFERK